MKTLIGRPTLTHVVANLAMAWSAQAFCAEIEIPIPIAASVVGGYFNAVSGASGTSIGLVAAGGADGLVTLAGAPLGALRNVVRIEGQNGLPGEAGLFVYAKESRFENESLTIFGRGAPIFIPASSGNNGANSRATTPIVNGGTVSGARSRDFVSFYGTGELNDYVGIVTVNHSISLQGLAGVKVRCPNFVTDQGCERRFTDWFVASDPNDFEVVFSAYENGVFAVRRGNPIEGTSIVRGRGAGQVDVPYAPRSTDGHRNVSQLVAVGTTGIAVGSTGDTFLIVPQYFVPEDYQETMQLVVVPTTARIEGELVRDTTPGSPYVYDVLVNDRNDPTRAGEIRVYAVPSMRRVATLMVSRDIEPQTIVFSGTRVVARDGQTGAITVITKRLWTQQTIPTAFYGGGINQMFFDDYRGKLYVPNFTRKSVSVIDIP